LFGIADQLFIAKPSMMTAFSEIYLTMSSYFNKLRIKEIEIGNQHVLCGQRVKDLNFDLNPILDYHYDHVICKDLDQKIYPKKFVKYKLNTKTNLYESIELK
jgi:hypothetical protein